MAECAVIFDVDGVLLELTPAEEDVFFEPFERRYGLHSLSRDWNSYRIRNDDHIVSEIFERHGLPVSERQSLIEEYHQLLATRLATGKLSSPAIPGAAQLLMSLNQKARLGIATANFLEAARLRLTAAGLWQAVSTHARGADGSGHKWQTLAALISEIVLPKDRIVYIGDNLNDVEAGLRNRVHFIGFTRDKAREKALKAAGAVHTSNDHIGTLRLVTSLLSWISSRPLT